MRMYTQPLGCTNDLQTALLMSQNTPSFVFLQTNLDVHRQDLGSGLGCGLIQYLRGNKQSHLVEGFHHGNDIGGPLVLERERTSTLRENSAVSICQLYGKIEQTLSAVSGNTILYKSIPCILCLCVCVCVCVCVGGGEG